MQRFFRIFLGLLLFVLVIEIVIIAPKMIETDETHTSQNKTNETEEGGLSTSSDEYSQSMEGVHLVEASESGKEWELWSDQAFAKDELSWKLKTVKAKFFGENGVVFNVLGDSGAVELKTKNIEIVGNVEVESSNGYIFKTENLIYKSKAKKFYTEAPIQMTGPKSPQREELKLKGLGLESHLETGVMDIKSDIRASIGVAKNQTAQIQSQRAQFSAKSRYARFLDNVIIDYDTMRVTGPDAVFNYDSKDSFVESLLVQGGIRVSDVDKWATSEKVNVNFRKDKFVFKGGPRLVQNNDELSGEEIIFLNGGKKIKVKQTKANFEGKELRGKK